MTETAERIVLASRPVGEPTLDNFRLEELPIPQPGPGQMLLRTLWLSLDPYMRGRMSDAPCRPPSHRRCQQAWRRTSRWVKVRPLALDKLKQFASKVPTPVSGLTSKNKTTLRQFDNRANFRRLFGFSNRLWAEVKRDTRPSFRTLVKAQAALGVGILCYMPVRLQNLSALKFDEHIFLHEGRNAISSLEVPANEVKNRRSLAFDIPPRLAKMLIEYRNRLAPKVIGRRPDRLFVKADGTAKNQWAVAWLIRTYLRKRAGLQLSPHQFRHSIAKFLLDAAPGDFETVRQLLGHASLQTTVAAYAGISSRRAARHHQRLVEEALAEQTPTRGR